jgi:hypothetical protein
MDKIIGYIIGIVVSHAGALLFFGAHEAYKLGSQAPSFYVIASAIVFVGFILILQGIKCIKSTYLEQ